MISIYNEDHVHWDSFVYNLLKVYPITAVIHTAVIHTAVIHTAVIHTAVIHIKNGLSIFRRQARL
ncbi:MAG: hypothetical protein PVF58_16200 [Candidatus Methanofastidiosia archaeon]